MSQPEAKETREDVGISDESRHRTVSTSSQPLLWFCPSRWLLAHNDLQANINTMSTHMCLADLNNDGENLLALVDFKQTCFGGSLPPKSPYECRMRVYRGQQLIYNHFLDDIPSSLIVSSISLPAVEHPKARFGNSIVSKTDSRQRSQPSLNDLKQQPLLTLAINDDVYFYHKLRPSHKLSLEDEECIMNSLNRSEVDAWQMVRQNKVDTNTMHELLSSLSQEHGGQVLTSHSQNFIALNSDEARKQYLVAWKLKGLQQGHNRSEQIMSMDTICCSAARLKLNSNITRSGDFGQTRCQPTQTSVSNRMLDLQKDGLLLGTEDRHLLIYELRSIRTRLECHYRLKAVPDHILVERRLQSSLDTKKEMRSNTYKILISCRNCHIYCIDQLYLVDEKSSPCEVRELIVLKSNVVEMSWTGLSDSIKSGDGQTAAEHLDPSFVVACLDRRVYCFSSQSGQCKWIIELELPITCLVCLPMLQMGNDKESLIGVASQANRVDFYVASSGRIVDSIYFSQDDYPQAMTFGRFGREDNCLCLVTRLGRLVVLILKRTARFAHGQCLSSAASYASHTMITCRQLLRETTGSCEPNDITSQAQMRSAEIPSGVKLSDSTNLPSAFSLSKSASTNVTDQMIDSMLQSSHNCEQPPLKDALDIHSSGRCLQIPIKGRDFVEQILTQSRLSCKTSQTFANQMIRLRDKIKSNFSSGIEESSEEGNRLVLVRVIGLGNIYRISLALKLNVEKFADRNEYIMGKGGGLLSSQEKDTATSSWSLTCLMKPRSSSLSNRKCQIKPFRVEILIENDNKVNHSLKPICETNIEAKLTMLGSNLEPSEGESLSVDVQVFASYHYNNSMTAIRQPFFITTVNIPLQIG